MENVTYFFCNLIIIISGLLAFAIIVKALVWLVKRLGAFVKRGIELLKSNKAATHAAEPVITVRFRRSNSVLTSSINDGSRHVRTTNLNERNKKPYKEKENNAANEGTNHGRTNLSQARAGRRISSINSFHGIGNVDRSLTHSQRRTYSDVDHQKEKNRKQERNKPRCALPVIMNSQQVKDYISSKDMFQKTVKGAPSWNWMRAPSRQLSDIIPKQKGKSRDQKSSKGRDNKHLKVVAPPVKERGMLRNEEATQNWNATRPSGGLHSDTEDGRQTYCNQTGDIGTINNSLMTMPTPRDELDQSRNDCKTGKVAHTANSIRYPVRLWSVDAVNAEAETSNENELQDHSENNRDANENDSPASVTENVNDNQHEPASTETNPKISQFSRILSPVANVMVHMVMPVVWPLCDYVKKEWDLFNDIYGESTEARTFTEKARYNEDPEVIACIKGEDRIHYHRYCPDNWTFCVAAPPKFTKDTTAQLQSDENTESANHHQGHIRKETWRATFTALWRKAKALAGQIKGAIPLLFSGSILAVAVVKSKVAMIVQHMHLVFSQIIPSHFLDVIQKRGDRTARVRHTNQAASPSKTKADKSYMTQPSPLNAEGSPHDADGISQRAGHHSQPSDVLLNTLKKSDLTPATNKRGVDHHQPIKAFSQHKNPPKEPRSRKEKAPLNDSPTVGHALISGSGERQAKFSPKGKVKKEVMSTLPSKVDEFANPPVGKEKRKKETGSANADLQAKATCQEKKKPMPHLIPTSYVNAVVRAKARVKDLSPRVGILNLVTSAKVNETSEESNSLDSHNKSSSEMQDVIEHIVSRGKRRYGDQDVTSSDIQASKACTSIQRSSTEGMPNPFQLGNVAPTTVERQKASIKRKAVKDTAFESQYETILVDPPMPLTKMLDKGIVEQRDMMEVGESVDLPLISHPEAMVVNNEPIVVDVSFEEMRAEYYERQASAASNLTKPDESMETNAQVEKKEQPETVEMKDVQVKVSSWNLFSFSLPNFLRTPFTTQPAAEEMEIVPDQEPLTQPVDVEMNSDEQSVSHKPSNEESEEMEISPPQLFAMATPSAQPQPMAQVAAGMGRPQTPFVSPQQAMEVTQQTVDGCRAVTSPFTKLTDAKRPLASTVRTLEETDLLVKMPTPKPQVNPTVMDQVIQPDMQSVAYSVVQPQAMQSVTQQPIPQLTNQEMMQQMMPSATHSVMQPSLEPTIQKATQSVMPQNTIQPDPVIVTSSSVPSGQLSQVDSSATGSQLYNPSSEGGISEVPTTTQTPLTSDVTSQEVAQKSRSQLTMEQLQLVPSTNYIDFSDSESEDDSDDEFELDLDTIEKFSVLEKSPDHAQFITKLLEEKESTQWHNIKDSDSDSDDGDKLELVELLDSETNDKFPEIEEDSGISSEKLNDSPSYLLKRSLFSNSATCDFV